HSIAGSFDAQYDGVPMKASMVPFEASAKQAKSAMIWPAPKTSIRKRPPLISSINVASRTAEPCITLSAGGQAVDIRHWTFGCAMTFGASAIVIAAAAATARVVFLRNRRRAVITLPPGGGDGCTKRGMLPHFDRGVQGRTRQSSVNMRQRAPDSTS